MERDQKADEWRQLELVVVWMNINWRFFRGLIQVLVTTCDDPHSNHIFLDLFRLFAWTKISPKIRKSLYGVGIGTEIFLPWEQ